MKNFILILFLLLTAVFVFGAAAQIAEDQNARFLPTPLLQDVRLLEKDPQGENSTDSTLGQTPYLLNANPLDAYGHRIIIKFSPGEDASFIADYLIQHSIPFRDTAPRTKTTDYEKLDEIHRAHGIKNMHRVFKNTLIEEALNQPQARSTPKAIGRLAHKIRALSEKKAYAAQPKVPFARRNRIDPSTIPVLDTTYVIEFTDQNDLERICAEYRSSPLVEYAVLDQLNTLNFIPNDPYYSSSGSWGQSFTDLYALKTDKLNGQSAWDVAQGAGAVVAVIDTGLDYNHPDISGNVWINQDEIPGNGIDDDNNGYMDDTYGYDFSDNDADLLDTIGHGTHCAGTIAALGHNTLGIIGVAPLAKVMPVKIFSQTFATDSAAAQAIVYAADNGADILSNSWGPISRRPSNPIVESAIDYAYALGCTVVFAAGNNSQDDVQYYSPANYTSKVISVAATNASDQVTSFSNIGNLISVSAPGQEILSLRANNTDLYGNGTHIVNGQYYHANGTSMACPHVAGVAALLVSNNPSLTNVDIRNKIIYSANNINNLNPGFEHKIGKVGRLNAYQALTLTPTPIIEFITYAIDDAVTGNQNNSPDAGETFDVVVTLRQSWAQSPDPASATITSQSPYVTFSSPTTLSLGILPLNADVDLAFSLTLSPQTPREESLNFQVNVSLSQNAPSQQIAFSLKIPLLPPKAGWPQSVPATTIDYLRSPVAADLNADGLKEIISCADDKIYVLTHNGTLMPGWPKAIQASMPAIADLDNDGDLEIITQVYRDITSSDCGTYIWHHDGTNFNQSWPVLFPPNPLSNPGGVSAITPAIGDIDGDGALEIVTIKRHPSSTSTDQNFSTAIFAYELDGSLMPGWPVVLTSSGVPMDSVSAPCLVDIDQDGDEDILQAYFTYDPGYGPVAPTPYSKLIALKHTGQILYNWNKTFYARILGTPVAGDIDSDGSPEILFTTENNQLIIFDHNGNYYNLPLNISWGGWSTTTAVGSIALADLNADALPEVIALSGGLPRLVTAIDPRTGMVMPGSWPQPAIHGGVLAASFTSEPSSIVVADLTGDHLPEIISQGGSYLFAYSSTGVPLPGYPFEHDHSIMATPLVLDIDQDDKNEIIFRDSSGFLHVFENPSISDPNRQPWPMAYHNLKHTSHYTPQTVTQTIELRSGWNMISFNVIPSDLNTAEIFSSIATNVQIVKDELGQIYYPATNTNSIGNINIEKGYQVKVFLPCILTITGIPVNPMISRNLSAGWHLIAYPLRSPVSIADALGPQSQNIEIMKDEDGKIFWPAHGVDQIGQLKPGEGYQVKVAQPFTLTYSASPGM